jgi:hypothetical protein
MVRDAFLQERLGMKPDTIPRRSPKPRIEPYIQSELVAA